MDYREAENEIVNYAGLYHARRAYHGAENVSDEHIEGKDATALVAYESKHFDNLPGGAEAVGKLKPLKTEGEIKGVNELLQKDYNNNDESGTLPFEIFNRWEKTRKERASLYPGWILQFYNPELLNKIKRERGRAERAVTPGAFNFVLYANEKMFACIAFEDVKALAERVKQCLPEEWDIVNFNMPYLTDEGYWSKYIYFNDNGMPAQWDDRRGGMIQNCWHIPFKTLADLATVTMIDGDPKIIGKNMELQRARLEYIKSYAWNLKIRGDRLEWVERRVTDQRRKAYDKLRAEEWSQCPESIHKPTPVFPAYWNALDVRRARAEHPEGYTLEEGYRLFNIPAEGGIV